MQDTITQEWAVPPGVAIYYKLIDQHQKRLDTISQRMDALLRRPYDRTLSIRTQYRRAAAIAREWSALVIQQALVEACLADVKAALEEAIREGAI